MQFFTPLNKITHSKTKSFWPSPKNIFLTFLTPHPPAIWKGGGTSWQVYEEYLPNAVSRTVISEHYVIISKQSFLFTTDIFSSLTQWSFGYIKYFVFFFLVNIFLVFFFFFFLSLASILLLKVNTSETKSTLLLFSLKRSSANTTGKSIKHQFNMKKGVLFACCSQISLLLMLEKRKEFQLNKVKKYNSLFHKTTDY